MNHRLPLRSCGQYSCIGRVRGHHLQSALLIAEGDPVSNYQRGVRVAFEALPMRALPLRHPNHPLHSFVVLANGGWGSGESVFLERSKAHLSGAAPRAHCIQVDAWKGH